MKPIELTIVAMGPYAQKEIIDFTKLKDKSLFLINGATGSGKTTILDAITFVLYGEPSGNERKQVSIRSHWADDDISTELELIFSVGQKKYRINRKPAQVIKKKRGDGFTEKKAEAELWLINPNGEEKKIAQKSMDVTKEIINIIGLDLSQFRQVIVLPQGEFRKVLTSQATVREKILEKLFNTSIYQRIVDNLKAIASDAKKETDKKSLEQKSILENLEIEDIDSLEDSILKMQGKIKTLNISKKEMKKEKNFLDEKLKEATVQNKLFIEYDENNERLKELVAQKEEFNFIAKKIEQAEKASKYADFLSNLNQLEDEIKEIDKNLESLPVEIKNIEKEIKFVLEKIEYLANKKNDFKKLSEKRSHLKNILPKMDRLDELRIFLKDEQNIEKNLRDKKKDSESKIKSCESKLEILNLSKDRLSKLKDKLLELKPLLEKIKGRDKLQKKVSELKIQFQKKNISINEEEKKRKVLHVEIIDLKNIIKEQEKNLFSNYKNLIVAELVPNTPCPICGSTEHPAPYLPLESEDNKIEAGEMNLLKEKLENLNRKYQNMEINISTLSVEAGGLEKSISEVTKELESNFLIKKDEILDLKEIEKNISDVENEIKTIEKALLEEKNISLELDKYKSGLNLLLDKLNETETNCKIKLEEQKSILKELGDYKDKNNLQEEIEKINQEEKEIELNEKMFFDKKVESLKRLNVSEERLKHFKDEKKNKAKSLRELYEQLEKRLLKDSFKSIIELKAAILEEEILNNFRIKLSDYNLNFSITEKKLSELKEKIAGRVKPNLQELENRSNELSEKYTAVISDISTVEERLSVYKKNFEKYQRISLELEKNILEYEKVERLAKLADGKNNLNLTFHKYILGALLDSVLESASQRLYKMSDERYIIQRSDKKESRGTSGLEMEIFDNYTGESRATHTLSGGEGFIAALSLALGLADVVQSYSGGIYLDTIFIDEGFGGLDPENIDRAMDVLMQLKEEGRLVGIISHVPELKERIDAKLEIISGERGSYTRFVL